MMIKLKNELYAKCTCYIEDRIKQSKEQIALLKESRNNETKSSVGDKYETGRAMIQIELEKSERQLAEAIKVKNLLALLKPEQESKLIKAGSLVKTNKGIYYITIGMGKVRLEGQLYFCISPEAPIAKVMIGKNQGDAFLFNQQKFEIIDFL